MAKLTYTEDELDLLTDDERAALTADDDEDDEVPEAVTQDQPEAKAQDHADQEKQDAEGTDGTDVDDAAAADAVEPAVAADAPAPSAAPDQAKGDEQAAKAVPPQPVFVAAAPEDLDGKLAAIQSRVKDALTKYNDGVMEFEDFVAIQQAATREEVALMMANEKAQMAAEMAQQQARNEWVNTATRFAAQHGYNANPILFDTFDRVVVSVATAQGNENMSYEQVLNAAHLKMIEAGLGKAQPATAHAAPAAQAAAPAAGKKAAAERPQQPPNLALVPAADPTLAGGNAKYAALDKLAETAPDQYEAELLKMSEAEQERYLRA